MTDLPRLRPDPIPAIYPLPEYLAEGSLKERYEDMKAVFQVPWMGVVTMAYAHYPTFYGCLWDGLRELSASVPFVEAISDLRHFAEREVEKLAPPPIAGRLADMGYAPREVAAIKDMVEVFSHGNYPYLLISTIVRMLLEDGEMSADRTAPAPFVGRHAPQISVPFVLMEAHHADQPTKDLFEDIKTTLNLPFVNTDYRAFARWPSWFSSAWADLRGVVTRYDHMNICRSIHARALAHAKALPNPAGLMGADLRQAVKADAPLAEVGEMARLFQWLLPGLVANVAFFRAQLVEP